MTISIYEAEPESYAQVMEMLMEGAVHSVTKLDIFCESEDVHLACSLCFPSLEHLVIRSKCANNELVRLMVENTVNMNSLEIIKNDLEFTGAGLSAYFSRPMKRLIIKPYVL